MSNRSVLSARSKARLTGFLATGRLVRKHGRTVVIGGSLLMAAGLVFAKGGTATPPKVSGVPSNPIFPYAGPALPSFSPLAFPNAGSTGDVGFSVSGHAQAVTLNGPCNGPGGAGQPTGGTVTINGMLINVPANTIVQFPANTMTFADAVCPTNLLPSPLGPPPPPPVPAFATPPSLMSSIALDGSGGTPTGVAGPQAGPVLPAVEFTVDGNILGNLAAATNAGVGSPHVAALISVSQQGLNAGAGFIGRIDYIDGSIYVNTGGGAETRLMMADPGGRFGRPQTGPDVRFSVDASNPTIKSGATGYPMCVPRTRVDLGIDDPQCPQANRPTTACRTFNTPSAAGTATLSGVVSLSAGGTAPFAGFRIPGADVSPTPPVAGGFCTGFVMKALAGYPGSIAAAALSPANVNALPLAAGQADPREQAPFEVGDFIQWAGTLVRGGNTPAAAEATVTGDLVWAHTIEANVGIYTQPATLPAYIAIGENGIGVDPQAKAALAAGLPGVEATARIFMEANTSDVSTLVDIYYDDKGFTPALPLRPIAAGGPFLVPTAGAEYFRWITTENMTGSLFTQSNFTNQNGAAGTTTTPYPVSAQPFGGGIETAYMGPQPGRARIRANTVPAINTARLNSCPVGGAPGTFTAGADQGCAVTNSPTRFIRAVLRSLCAPAGTGQLDNAGLPIPATNIDNGVVAGGSPWIDVNAPLVGPGAAPVLPGAGPAANSYPGLGPDQVSSGLCFERAQFANGLFSGQYTAPVGEFIFPENTLAGVPVVPATTWQLGFIAYGEGSTAGGSTGASVAAPAPTPY